MQPRPSFIASFSRSQVSSCAATLIDYGVLLLLKEGLQFWYVTATACGALVGALVNFILNRHWSFQATHSKIRHQALRYALVSVGSLILNTIGVYFFTEYIHIHYAISVVLISIMIGFLFNYPLHRHYVYRL